jgi:hypothetical protein
VKTAASALLLLLTLLFGIAAGTTDLVAQTAPTGTWFFTGVTGSVSGSDSTSSNLLKGGKLTITASGGTYGISYDLPSGADWSGDTDGLTLATPTDPTKAPSGIFTAVLSHISVASGTSTRAKFTRVDDNTWLFYLVKSSTSGSPSQLNGRGIVGVLTRSALPDVVPANWTKTFALSGISWDQWDSGSFESYYGTSAALMKLYQSGIRYYSHFEGTPRNTWQRGFEYDADNTLVSSYVSNSQIGYDYEPSGDLINGYFTYEGNFTYNYDVDGTLLDYSERVGNAEYYYDADNFLTGSEKYENNSWNYYDADGVLTNSYPDDYYAVESGYLHMSREDGDAYVIQLSGNRLAEISTNFVWGIELNVLISSDPLSPTDIPWQPALPAAPEFTTNLAATSTPNAAGDVVLSVVVTGTPTPTFQWQTRTNSSAEWTDISNGNTEGLVLHGLAYAHNGTQYRVIATNARGTVYSNTTTLSGIALPSSTPTFTRDLSPTTSAPSSAVTLLVTAAGTPVPTLQWQKSTDVGATWTNVSGATTTSLDLSSLTYLNNGDQYRVAATNTAGTTYSTTTALVDIPGAPTAPEFVTNLPPTTSAPSGSVTLTVTVSGTPVLLFQWQKSTNSGATWVNVSGGSTASLALNDLTYLNNGDQYRVTVSNSYGGPITSNATTLAGAPATPPRVVGTPVVTGADKLAIHKNALQTAMDAIRGISSPDYEVAAGSNVSYAVSAIGEGLTYQWRKDGEDIPGATGSTYTAPDVRAADGYSVVVTNVDGGNVETAVTTPSFVARPEIVTQPAANTSLTAGGTATLSVTARGGSQFYYQWYTYDPETDTSEAIPFAILPTLTVSEEGSYFVVVNNRANVPVTSEVAEVAVGRAAPSFTLNLLPSTLAVNNAVTFTVAVTGLPAPELQWQTRANSSAGWTDIPGATGTTLTRTGLTTADNNTQYQAVATNSEGTANSVVTTVLGIPVVVTPTVNGTVNGIVRDALSNAVLGAATLTFYNEAGISVGSTVSNSRGIYAIALPVGLTRIEASRTGYISTQSSVNVAENTATEAAVIFLAPNGSGNGTISGNLINAFTGGGVSGVTLRLRAGANVTTGQILQTATASSSYTLSAPGGAYTLEASATGYVTTYTNVVAVGGNTIGNQDITLSPLLTTAGEIRIVLTWGASPSDLDSHLTGPSSTGGTFHTFFSAKNPSGSSTSLDVDDVSSYGPETITISQLRAGTYTYTVRDYTNWRDDTISRLTASGAKVVVYRATGGTTVKVAEYNVPSNGSGYDWEVFRINGTTGTITPINRIYNVLEW